MADQELPAEQFAEAIRSVLASGGITLDALADSIDVHPHWLRKVMTGEIIELPLLTVVGICRRLRIMPEDIWDAALVASAFRDFGPGAFDPDEA